MSNIPSSAMPHAWAHDDEDREEDERTEEGARSLRPIIIAGGVGALLLYWMLRK